MFPACKKCFNEGHVRRSRRRIHDYFVAFANAVIGKPGMVPYRCKTCGSRFYGVHRLFPAQLKVKQMKVHGTNESI